ncbi:MAG: tyrosine-type recombinase/integrase [Cyanobacteriota bacterium]
MVLAQQGSFSSLVNQDVLTDLLADQKSSNTRRTYAKSLKDFFVTIAGVPPTVALVQEFLSLKQFDAIALVLRYRSILIGRGLSPATINVRLSAVKSLVNYARKVGRCEYSLSDVEGLRVQIYRDTSGVDKEQFRSMLAQLDRTTLKGKRDYALLRLLWDNALRRNEISQTNVEDFDGDQGQLWIQGKGSQQKELVDLSAQAVEAINLWMQTRGEVKRGKPLFITLDRATRGTRLGGNAIYQVVRQLAKSAGIRKPISPHRIRHSAITAALDATNGDTRRVQKFSRHVDLNTLTKYDDNRRQHQKEVTTILADLI